jgi:glycerate kinase
VDVLIACDKFRGSMTAVEANAAVAAALAASALPARSHSIAIADGGEGTLEALSDPGTERIAAVVPGPYGTPVEASFLWDAPRRRAVIELAAVAGHPHARAAGYDPHRASSAGVGALLLKALDRGAREAVIALGGSITVDAGAGALAALGARYWDAAGAPVDDRVGEGLLDVARVDLSGLDRRLADLSVIIAADVDNPLVGPNGAAAVFGPQKGVAADEVARFDAALGHFDRLLAAARGTAPLADAPFAGAAGGMLVGLSAAAPTVARDGFALVAEHHGLEAQIAAADLIVTGEGSLDRQSLGGKGPVAVARMAAAAGRPAIAFAGRLAVAADDLRPHGIVAAFAIGRGPATLAEALAAGPDALRETARSAFDLLALSPPATTRPSRTDRP